MKTCQSWELLRKKPGRYSLQTEYDETWINVYIERITSHRWEWWMDTLDRRPVGGVGLCSTFRECCEEIGVPELWLRNCPRMGT